MDTTGMSKYAAKKARQAEEAARAERLAHEESQTRAKITVERAEVDPDDAAKRRAQSEADKARFDVKCYAGLGRIPELVCEGIGEALKKVNATLFFADELKDCAKSQAKSEAEALRNSLWAVGQKLNNLGARYARIVERSNHALACGGL